MHAISSFRPTLRPFRPTRTLGLALAAIVAAATLGAVPATAQLDTGSGLRATVYGASVTSVFSGEFDSASGLGLGLEYRASRHLGVELTALTSTLDSEIDFDFFGIVQLGVESKMRVTPVLAQLDFHLTPDHAVDLSMGPVVGWMRYGDLESKVRSHVFGEQDEVETERVRTKDGFAWGAHIDFDVPLGPSRAYFTGGATYLSAAVKAAPGQGSLEGDTIFDLNPLVLKAGLAYRF